MPRSTCPATDQALVLMAPSGKIAPADAVLPAVREQAIAALVAYAMAHHVPDGAVILEEPVTIGKDFHLLLTGIGFPDGGGGEAAIALQGQRSPAGPLVLTLRLLHTRHHAAPDGSAGRPMTLHDFTAAATLPVVEGAAAQEAITLRVDQFLHRGLAGATTARHAALGHHRRMADDLRAGRRSWVPPLRIAVAGSLADTPSERAARGLPPWTVIATIPPSPAAAVPGAHPTAAAVGRGGS